MYLDVTVFVVKDDFTVVSFSGGQGWEYIIGVLTPAQRVLSKDEPLTG